MVFKLKMVSKPSRTFLPISKAASGHQSRGTVVISSPGFGDGVCDAAGAPCHAAAALQPRAGPGHQLRAAQPSLAPRLPGGGYILSCRVDAVAMDR